VVRKAATDGQAPGQTAFWTNAFPVSAISAVSRRHHGGTVNADFDLPLPLSGAPGVECRNGGITQIIFTFPLPVAVNTGAGTGGASITSGTGSVVAPPNGVIVSGTTVTVNLSGVTDRQWITLTLLGANDGTNTNDVAVRAGVLFGDVNGSTNVDAADVGQVQRQNNKPLTSSNYTKDVNLSGNIDAADVGQVQRQNSHHL
jgi:hypothetical protein